MQLILALLYVPIEFYCTLLIFWRAPLLPRAWLSIICGLHFPTWQLMPVAEAELLPLCWYRQVWEQEHLRIVHWQSSGWTELYTGFWVWVQQWAHGNAHPWVVAFHLPVTGDLPSVWGHSLTSGNCASLLGHALHRFISLRWSQHKVLNLQAEALAIKWMKKFPKDREWLFPWSVSTEEGKA